MLTSVPLADLGLAFALCLAVSSLGFRRVDHFISIGYGFSIAAEAVVFVVLHRDTLDAWRLVQSLLLLAYGLRLGIFLTLRERQPSFAAEYKASQERSARVQGMYKLLIWVAVSALYVAMYFPALASLAAAGPLTALPWGVAVMVLGLGLEAAADAQKSRLKAKNPKDFAHAGLFALVRYPSYFGEMLFWLGTFVSGLGAYRAVGDWLLAVAGLVCIELVMLGSARRLELKQEERHGGDAAFKDYVRRVPVLIPLLPLHSLKRLRIYLG